MSGWGEFATGIDRFAKNLNERRAQKAEHERFQRSHRVTMWGFLGPGDPPPLPEYAERVHDYRGLAPPGTVEMLRLTLPDGRLFPVGHVVEVRTPMNGFQPGPLFPIGVPFDILRHHAVIVGRSGSGKTRYVIVPWIYAALHSSSVVALDAKGDMLDLVMEHASGRGSHHVPAGKWDYTDPAGSMSWDWIADIDDEHSLDAALTAILGRADKQGSADPFFYRRDRQLLGGLLQLAAALGLHSASAMMALLADQQKVHDVLRRFAGTRGAIQIQAGVGNLDALDYNRATQGVSNALQQLATPNVDRVTSGSRRRLRLDDLLSGRRLLVVVAPTQGGETSEILSGLFLNLFAQRLYRRFRGATGQVFLFIDEAPRFVHRFDFEKTLSVARSAGASIVLALQDVAQFKEENERSAVISNCATWLSLSGVEESTVKFLQGRLGKHNVAFWSQGTFSHRPGLDLRTQVESRPVLGEREIAFPPGSRAAILHMKASHLPASPVLVDLEPHPWRWEKVS
jgi:hypothetical protein